jgi:hypothetical protein
MILTIFLFILAVFGGLGILSFFYIKEYSAVLAIIVVLVWAVIMSLLISSSQLNAATIPPVSRIPAMRAYIPTLNKVFPCDQINVHNGVSKCYFYRTDLVKGKNVTKLIYAGKGIIEMSTGKFDIHGEEIWQDTHLKTPGFEDGVVMFGNQETTSVSTFNHYQVTKNTTSPILKPIKEQYRVRL